MKLYQVFYYVDEFCKSFEKEWRQHQVTTGEIKRVRQCKMTMSEVMVIVIWFHQSYYKNFKYFYKDKVQHQYRDYFPDAVSYSRFVELMQGVLIPLIHFLKSTYGKTAGVAFIDSTTIKVCHNKRINNHKVFKGVAERGQSSMGWFYGFKLHIVVNDKGELLSVALTKGNVDDRNPKVIAKLTKNLFGLLFGDKGYLSQPLFEELFKKGIKLITKLRSNMKNKFISVQEKYLLRKRAIIETINDQLKNISMIEHSRHRSPINFLVNLFSGLIAYSFAEKKPSLKMKPNQLALI